MERVSAEHEVARFRVEEGRYGEADISLEDSEVIIEGRDGDRCHITVPIGTVLSIMGKVKVDITFKKGSINEGGRRADETDISSMLKTFRDKKIGKIDFLNSVKEVSNLEMEGCKIDKVDFSGIKVIKRMAFKSCEVGKIEWGDTIEEIQREAFKGVEYNRIYIDLSKLTKLERVGERALDFRVYEGIRRIKMPKEIEVINVDMFEQTGRANYFGTEIVCGDRTKKIIGNGKDCVVLLYRNNSDTHRAIQKYISKMGNDINVVGKENKISSKTKEELEVIALKMKALGVTSGSGAVNKNLEMYDYVEALRIIKEANRFAGTLSVVREGEVVADEKIFNRLVEMVGADSRGGKDSRNLGNSEYIRVVCGSAYIHICNKGNGVEYRNKAGKVEVLAGGKIPKKVLEFIRLNLEGLEIKETSRLSSRICIGDLIPEEYNSKVELLGMCKLGGVRLVDIYGRVSKEVSTVYQRLAAECITVTRNGNKYLYPMWGNKVYKVKTFCGNLRIVESIDIVRVHENTDLRKNETGENIIITDVEGCSDEVSLEIGGSCKVDVSIKKSEKRINATYTNETVTTGALSKVAARRVKFRGTKCIGERAFSGYEIGYLDLEGVEEVHERAFEGAHIEKVNMGKIGKLEGCQYTEGEDYE